MYFVKDLKDFKLLDDANILLRTSRQRNMYSIDLNNIVPHKDLTCLVAKASAAECMLWHRRLEAARTMLADAKLPVTFWAEAVNTACYVQNRVLVNKSHNKTPYELFNGRSPTIGFLKPFGCHVMILNTLDTLGKFEGKGDKCYFIGYSMSRKEFRVFNKRTRRVEENLHVEFLENKAIEKGVGPNWLFDIDSLTKSMNYVPVDAGTISTNISGTKNARSQEVKKNVSSLRYIALRNWAHDALLESSSSKPQDRCSTEVLEGSGNPNPTASTSNPPDNPMEILTVESSIPIVSSPVLTVYSTDSQEPSSDARLISKRVANQEETPSLDNILSLTNRFEDILGDTTNSYESNGVEADISNMETAITASPTPTLRIHKDHPKKPKEISDALQDPRWVEAMQEELLQFKIQNVWTLVDCPKGVRPIGTKWVLKNKKDKRGIVIRNMARLVAQGHTQEEGIDYDEVFSPVARIKAIKLFLAYASFMGFTVYHMDVKSAFLYGSIDKEVYVMQPPGFQDLEFPVKVYKVEKAMYGLHQAPRAWYGTLSKYLLKNGFQKGTIDQTLFIKRQREDFIPVQVYIDDIIFGSSNPQLCREFEALMHEKFQMSAMGELNFLLGLQVLQKEDGIFLSQDKYVGDILKKFGYSKVRSSNTLMDKENPWGKDGIGKDVDLHLYRSMIGSLMYLTTSRPDIMFVVCICARHQLTPKECHLHAVKRIFRYLKGHPKLGLGYPKESPFDLVAYSDSDYGEYVAAASCYGQVLWIQNQLFDYGDCFEKKLINVDHIYTDENVTDLLTKPFDAGRFQYLVCKLFPLLGKLSTVSVFLGFGLTFAGTSKYLGILRILMISLRLIPLVSKGYVTMKACCKTCWSIYPLRHCEKSKHKIDFHPMVDFVEASLLRYALTFKPTVYVSHIRQFWSTARIETTEEGTKILATVDGIIRTVTESSLRRNLKLQDEEGTPIEPHHIPSPEAQPPSHTTHSLSTLPFVTTTSIPTVTPSDTTPIRQYTQRARIAQSSTLPTIVDKPKSPLRDISQGEACPTDYGFIADQDRATIANLQRQYSELAGKFKAQEIEITRLKARVKLLEDRQGVATEGSRDDAPIKGRNLDEGDAADERASDDTEEMAIVLTSIDEATVLASGAVEVPTGSGSIPTAGPPAAEVPNGSDVVPTASPVFATATVVTPYKRRKGKEVMVESETPKKQKVQEKIDAQVSRELEEKLEREDQRRSKQIGRDAEITRIHAEEELQIMIDGLDRNNETIAKYLQEYHQFTSELPIERRIELISDLVKYQDNYTKMEDFIPMGSKEEAERIKRKGLSLEQESAKKQKTSEEVHIKGQRSYWKITRLGGSSASYQFFIDLLKHLDREDLNQLWRLVKENLSNRPPTNDKEMELWVELSRLYEPDDEDQLWTHTQNFMHAPVEWKLYDLCRVHHVTSKDKEIFMLVEKDYPLRKGLALVMIWYKLQVENYLQMANDLILKIYKIANSPRQQGIEFPLTEEVPTASEEGYHYQKKRKATARKIALLSKSRRNCQSKSNDSFTKLVPHVTPCILRITIIVTSCTRTPCPIKGVL
nr:hypothetical protein [Tanacetum cinerariifolium]